MILRQAISRDVPALTALLNEIISIGGTTAFETPLSEDSFSKTYLTSPFALSCIVAEEAGELLGFQSLEWADPDWAGPEPLPADWLCIGTFARVDQTGRGVGAALFTETLKIARKTSATAIDATIRADNTGGCAYYSKMGFADYDRLVGIPLLDGTPVDRLRKRFDLQATSTGQRDTQASSLS